MSDVKETRRKRLELLRSETNLTWKELGKKLGLTTGSFLSQLRSGERDFSEKTAREFERKMGLSTGWLDRDTSEVKTPTKRVDTDLTLDVAMRVYAIADRDKRHRLSQEQLRKIMGMAAVAAARDGKVNEDYIHELFALAGIG